MKGSAARRRDYETYIASPAWEAKRQRALRKQGNTCRACGSPGPALHVHHHTYDRFRNEHDSDLVVLCKPCHETIHRKSPSRSSTQPTPAPPGSPHRLSGSRRQHHAPTGNVPSASLEPIAARAPTRRASRKLR